ncbi:MAG: hypothetical protein ACI9ES_001600 [Oceanospirillaceae bacterium]|jgi:hypothetical protein
MQPIDNFEKLKSVVPKKINGFFEENNDIHLMYTRLQKRFLIIALSTLIDQRAILSG